MVDIGLRIDESGELHGALECFDIDLRRLQGIVAQYGGLDLQREHGVVDVFTCRLMGATGRAAHECDQDERQQVLEPVH